MSKNNLFDGDSYKAIFAGITYKLLIGREWIKYADVMAKFNGLSSVKELKHNVSDYDYYGELKKAFPAVCDVFLYGAAEQPGILEHHREVVAQLLSCEASDVPAVYKYRTAIYIIKPHE